MKLKQPKGAFTCGGAHRLRKSKNPACTSTLHATSLPQYTDHIQKKVANLNRQTQACAMTPLTRESTHKKSEKTVRGRIRR